MLSGGQRLDVHTLHELLHGDECKVWGDAGYQGQTEAIRAAAPQAQDMTSRRVNTKAGVDEVEKRENRVKSRVRAKVEWPFRILKLVLGFTRVRYRGLRAGQPLQEPQATGQDQPWAGPSGGVACPPEATASPAGKMNADWD